MQNVHDLAYPGPGEDSQTDGGIATTLPLFPCDALDAYNVERIGPHLYRLALAVPGFDADDIEVQAEGGFLRVTGASRDGGPAGEVLHRGLDERLDCTFLMTRPLDVADIEVRCGLLRIVLRDSPGSGVEAVIPPRLQGIEALAIAA